MSVEREGRAVKKRSYDVVLQSRQLAANDNQSQHGLGGEATVLAMMRLLRCG